jgi:hypothetical protein
VCILSRFCCIAGQRILEEPRRYVCLYDTIVTLNFVCYYLIAVALTPGGSSTVPIYAQTVHRIQRTEHTWAVQKVSGLNVFRLNHQAREVPAVDEEGTFMRMRELFPAYRKRQSPAVSRLLCTCCERSADCQVLQNDGTN